MKKVLLIGKMNAVLKDLHTFLTDYYQIQLCSEALDVVEGMVKIVQPDLALVSLVGEPDRKTAIMTYLTEDCAPLPVSPCTVSSACRREASASATSSAAPGGI